MGRRLGGGKKPLPFISSSKRSSSICRLPSLPKHRDPSQPPPPPLVAGTDGKKKVGTHLWMRLDRWGGCEILECDKAFIARRSGVPARDLRVLGPVFSHSSSILPREKAMVINMEFIRAIVTSEEVLLLDPLVQEVLPFVQQLRQHFPMSSLLGDNGAGAVQNQHSSTLNEATGAEHDLPFEFQVLELALETVCSSLDSSVTDLEKHTIPVLDELPTNVSTRNLECVRRVKSNLTHLLAHVQKVRNEIEHLLDDNENMAHLYLTRKQIQSQQFEALVAYAASNGICPTETSPTRLNFGIQHSMSIPPSVHLDNDVEDLEMLLEAYFMQLDGIHNRILLVREYVDDTEDYVSIQLDNQRNELIQLQLTLAIVSFGIAISTLIIGAFAMNFPCSLYQITDGSFFWPFVGSTSSSCLLITIVLLGYARWKKLLGH